MSKKISLLFVVLLISLLTACSGEDISEFTGTITGINGNVAIVDAKIGGGDMVVLVDLSVNKEASFKIGDVIKVQYEGGILESYPARIETKSVELVELVELVE